MDVLTVACFKGGSGKTVVTVGVAAVLAARGLRVLVVDSDAQANAGLVLSGGQVETSPPDLGDVLMGQATVVEAARPCACGVDLLPAGRRLADVTVGLANEIGRERRLRLALNAASQRWDVVLIDTNPALNILSVNALNASRGVLVPIDPGVFALTGLGELRSTIAQVARFLDAADLTIRRVVLSRYRRDRVSRDVSAMLRAELGELVAAEPIPQAAVVETATARFQPVTLFDPGCPVSQSLISLAAELVPPCQLSRAVA